MKIWHKILVAPAVAILFLLAFGAVSYLVVQRHVAALEEIGTTRRAGVALANDVAQQASAAHAGVYRLFTWRSAMTEDGARQAEGELLDQLDAIQGYLTGFRAQPHVSEDERRHVNAVLEKLAEYREQVREVMERTSSASGAALMMRGPDETFAQMVGELGALATLEKNLADASHEEANEASRIARGVLLAILAVATLSSIAVSIAVARGIVRPLEAAIASAQRIAAGDLGEDIRVRGRDETADLLRALAEMTRHLRALVAEVAAGAHNVADTSAQIAQGNVDLSQRTEEQAGMLEETASSMEQLTATVSQNAQNAQQASQIAADAAQLADRGGEAMARAIATMGGIAEASRRIGDIIGVIDGIAFQTNILALNAAVEAARAGEQGRGFAVVAAEVRNLAQRSAAAAKEVKALIGDSVARVDEGTRMVDGVGATIRDMVEAVRKVSALIAEIAAASQEQSAGIGQVNGAVVQMEQVVQQNASLVEEASAATEALHAQAMALLRRIERFRLGGAGPVPLEPVAPPPAAMPHAAEALPGAEKGRLGWS